MDYRIDIIDTQSQDVLLSREKALASSVILEWKGGDTKDQAIMGSTLKFTLAGLINDDGQYYDLFTGDESRYRVELVSEDEERVWSGHILPDAYSEPYSNAPILVDFVATDGLGRLKGKYPEFEGEPSVIEIISQCLEMTGLDMDFRFASAIENYQEKDWSKIYPDSRGYEDKDAYTILNDLLNNLGCSIFQQDNHFNIIGWNVRNLQYYYTKVYSISGEYLRGELVERLKKDVTGLATPNITMQPPYGVIEVRHDRENVSLPEGLSSTSDEDWVNYSSSVDSGEIYADEWVMEQSFPALSKEGTVYFGKYEIGQTAPMLRIKRRPYLERWERYRLKMGFRLVEQDENAEVVDISLWSNPFIYTILIGQKPIYTNNRNSQGVLRSFGFSEDNKDIELDFEFVASNSGLLDVHILPINAGNDDNIKYIEITTMELENVTFKEEELSRDTKEGYTEVKEVDLTYAGDATGASVGFRLAKLEPRNQYKTFTIPVKRQFLFRGENVVIVDLKGAEIIDNNIDEVYTSQGTLTIDRVEYNYNGSQEHALITDTDIPGIGDEDPMIEVRVYDFNTASGNRDNWEKWTDAIYGIEQKKYTDAYLGLLSRLFNEPLPKIDMEVYDNIQINDILMFPYMGEKDFILTSCKWNLDKGRSTITGIESYYGSFNQLPPMVEVGDDIYFSQDVVQVTSEGYSPNGTIESYYWEVMEGDGTFDDSNVQNPTITVTGNKVILQVTVTDNMGMTASDTVTLYRRVNVHIELNVTPEGFGKKAEIIVTPELPSDYSIKLEGSFSDNMPDLMFEFTIEQNGVEISRVSTERGIKGDKSQEFSLNYVAGDEIIFYNNHVTWPGREMILKIANADFSNGQGIISGIPIIVDLYTPPI